MWGMKNEGLSLSLDGEEVVCKYVEGIIDECGFF